MNILKKATVAILLASSAVSLQADDTPLGHSMEDASAALKSLRKMDKSDWQGGAAAAHKAAKAILEGIQYEPLLVKEISDSNKKAAAMADYRRLMGLSYAALCQLESAYLAQNAEQVEEAMELIKQLKKEGHKKYED